MRKIRVLWMAMLAVALAVAPSLGEAKSIGAKTGKSGSTAKKLDDVETKAGGSTAVSSRLSLPVAAGTGAAAGAAAAAEAEPPASAAEKQAEAVALAEQKRLEKLGELDRKAAIEEVGKKAEQAAAEQKALAARRETERLMREQEAEAKRRADEDRQAQARVKAIERDRSCIIKPVMSDAEITHCKWAWSVPPPG